MERSALHPSADDVTLQALLQRRYSVFERDTLHSDREFVNRFNYSLLILDEGHCIKNHTSKRYLVHATVTHHL